jgi:hypothetical protein
LVRHFRVTLLKLTLHTLRRFTSQTRAAVHLGVRPTIDVHAW